MHYLISIKYDGSKFWGFQRLNNKPTIQGEIEKALSIINKKPVVIKGAGRTDRKVHALDQKASFSLDINIEVSHLKQALNSLIKPYIFITDIKVVEENFHARFNVLKKEYIYKINLGEYNPLLEDYVLQIHQNINIKLMKKAAKKFIGIHNFQNFVSGKRDNYNCIIYNIDFKHKNNFLEIKFIGKSFYRYMVRNLVGAMLDVALNKRTIKDIEEAINTPEIKKEFTTSPPNGLYLHKISYK